MNSNVNLNLLKLKSAGVMNIQGNTTTKECIVIPVEENQIFVARGDDGRAKGAYLSLTMWENQTPSQYGDTHYIKQQFNKEYRESHAEEMKQTPILGNVKPIKGKEQAFAASETSAVAMNNGDLPF